MIEINNSSHTTWLICPICKSKTRTKLRKDTVLKIILFTVLNAKMNV